MKNQIDCGVDQLATRRQKEKCFSERLFCLTCTVLASFGAFSTHRYEQTCPNYLLCWRNNSASVRARWVQYSGQFGDVNIYIFFILVLVSEIKKGFAQLVRCSFRGCVFRIMELVWIAMFVSWVTKQEEGTRASTG